MKDLGTLGGTNSCLGGALWLSNRGEVVGDSLLAGDLTCHPVLRNGKSLVDLGFLGGDFGTAYWVNDSEEVVGFAFNNSQQFRAFLWRAEAVVKVQPISNRRLDGLSEWLLKHGFALNRRNWCELNWGFDKTDEEIQALVEGRGDGEELAEIPRYLSGQDDNGDPIPPGKKAKIIRFKRN